MQNLIYFRDTANPYQNLALEEALFDGHQEGCLLYVWQNQNTVVIGRNQNAWKECRVSLLEQEGGRLARRGSGGGAVFHDLGNINFTFIVPRAQYDVRRQLSVIQRAVASFGIRSEFSGRNDLIEAKTGAKFSGNAFRLTEKTAMHHGTLLVDVDMDKLTRYLAPSPEKLQAKGVESVRARVMNLREEAPSITVKAMRDALVDAFIALYGPARVGQESALDKEDLFCREERYASWEWRMGSTPKFDVTMERRFNWGSLELQLCLREGIVWEAVAYSDSMEEEWVGRLGPALVGAQFRSKELGERARRVGNEQADAVAEWLEETGF